MQCCDLRGQADGKRFNPNRRASVKLTDLRGAAAFLSRNRDDLAFVGVMIANIPITTELNKHSRAHASSKRTMRWALQTPAPGCRSQARPGCARVPLPATETPVTWYQTWGAAWQRLFGYDFFISYAWLDSRPYAEALEKALGAPPHRFRCFLDRKEMGGGRGLAFVRPQGPSPQLCHGIGGEFGGAGTGQRLRRSQDVRKTQPSIDPHRRRRKRRRTSEGPSRPSLSREGFASRRKTALRVSCGASLRQAP